MRIFALIAFAVTAGCTDTIVNSMRHVEFQDVTRQAGLVDPLLGMMGHGVAWGDVDGNGYPDLFVGTFSGRPDSVYAHRSHPATPAPNQLMLNNGDGTFRWVQGSPVSVHGRNSGAVFADFDNDGDLDLVTSHNSYDGKKEITRTGNFLFENNGEGAFTDVTDRSGLDFGLPFTGRNTFVLDYNGDGLIDLFMQEDWLREDVSGGNSRLMKNKGGLTFEDATTEAELPSGFRTGLWGAGGWTGDINGDMWPDFFFAHSCQLFINNRDGTFHELDHELVPEGYRHPGDSSGQLWTCGADIGDLDNDGDMDFVIGDHLPLSDTTERKIFIILNEGNDKNGDPFLRDVTAESGLIPPENRAPVVLLQDVDNDGKNDLIVANCDQFVYRNLGISDGIPQFDAPVASGIQGGLGYWPAGALSDFDRDGKLDFFGAEWEPGVASSLLRNITTGAQHYLAVKLELINVPNRNGIGARVELYKTGMVGEKEALIASRTISISNGYSSGNESIAYFGLPNHKIVDIRVSMPCGGQVIDALRIKRNQMFIFR